MAVQVAAGGPGVVRGVVGVSGPSCSSSSSASVTFVGVGDSRPGPGPGDSNQMVNH